VEWDHPHDGNDPWACFEWNRRTYGQVMGAPAPALELLTA
jgi:hypothetical protein